MNQPAFLYCTYLPNATVSATDTASGAAAEDVLYATEDTFWRPADQTGDKAVTVDLQEQRYCDRLGILGNALDGCRVDVLGSSDNMNFDLLATGAVLSARSNAVSVPFSAVTHRYWRIVFKSGYYPSNLRVSWLCWARSSVLPYMADGAWNPDDVEVAGEHLVSRRGLYLGAELEKAMSTLNLNFGQVTDFEFVPFASWRDACVAKMAPFFFIADVDQPDAYFGWPPQRFSAPQRLGMREVGTITMTTRVE